VYRKASDGLKNTCSDKGCNIFSNLFTIVALAGLHQVLNCRVVKLVLVATSEMEEWPKEAPGWLACSLELIS